MLLTSFALKVGPDEYQASYIPQVKMLYLLGTMEPKTDADDFARIDYMVKFVGAAVGKTGVEWAASYSVLDISMAFNALQLEYAKRGFFGRVPPAATIAEVEAALAAASRTTGESSTGPEPSSAGAEPTPMS